MMSPVRAAILYFAVVFAAGFIFGALRVAVVAPRTGGISAVLVELPLMLGLSWLVAGRLVSKLREPVTSTDRLAMGSLGLALLLLAEFGLGVWGFGRTPSDQFAAWVSKEGLLGLAGQLAFGVFPLLVRPRDARTRRRLELLRVEGRGRRHGAGPAPLHAPDKHVTQHEADNTCMTGRRPPSMTTRR